MPRSACRHASSIASNIAPAFASVSRYSYAGSESATTPRAGLHVRDVVLDHDRADVDAGVEVAGVAQIADRAAVEAALHRLELVDDLHRPDLRRARRACPRGAPRAAHPSRLSRAAACRSPRRRCASRASRSRRSSGRRPRPTRTRTRARGRCGPGRRASRARRAPSRRAAGRPRRAGPPPGSPPAGGSRRSGAPRRGGPTPSPAAPGRRPRSRSRPIRGSTCRATGSRPAARGR